jgi:hypothetical protein
VLFAEINYELELCQSITEARKKFWHDPFELN